MVDLALEIAKLGERVRKHSPVCGPPGLHTAPFDVVLVTYPAAFGFCLACGLHEFDRTAELVQALISEEGSAIYLAQELPRKVLSRWASRPITSSLTRALTCRLCPIAPATRSSAVEVRRRGHAFAPPRPRVTPSCDGADFDTPP